MSEQEATLDEFLESDESSSGERIETPIGELPSDWTVEWLEDICSINPDGFSEDDWPDETFEYISLSDVSEGTILQSETTPVDDAPSRAQRKIKEGDVLVGTVRPKQVSHGFVTEEHDGKICSSGFGVLRSPTNLNPLYLLQEVLSHRFFRQMEAYVAGSGYPAVKIGDLRKHRIAVPSPEEQDKIASTLYTVDQAIQLQDDLVDQTKRVKGGLMKTLFTEGYHDHDSLQQNGWRCKAKQIPKEWDIAPADDLLTIRRGASPRPRSDDTLFGGDIPWIKIGDADREGSQSIDSVESYVTEKGKSKSEFVNEGTLLVANSGATCGFAVFAGLDGCVHDGWLILEDYEEFDKKYLYHYINWNHEYLRSLSLGSAQTNLSTYLFGRLDIPKPPIEEQREIADILDSLEKQQSQYRTEKKQLKRLKKGLMQDLLSGRVRTHDKDIELVDDVLQHG